MFFNTAIAMQMYINTLSTHKFESEVGEGELGQVIEKRPRVGNYVNTGDTSMKTI